MIVINKLAKDALSNSIASGRVTSESSPKSFLLQATVHLGDAHKAKPETDERMPIYTQQEFTVADTINWLLAFLERVECEDIEQLLKDAAKYRRKHPDYLKGNWPK